jgi:hypothetical protein
LTRERGASRHLAADGAVADTDNVANIEDQLVFGRLRASRRRFGRSSQGETQRYYEHDERDEPAAHSPKTGFAIGLARYTEDVSPATESAATSTTLLLDAEGRPTDDPALAVRGETIEYDAQGRPIGKTSFFLQEGELRWLPIGELPFLLWVLAIFVVIWFAIAIVLRAT